MVLRKIAFDTRFGKALSEAMSPDNPETGPGPKPPRVTPLVQTGEGAKHTR